MYLCAVNIQYINMDKQEIIEYLGSRNLHKIKFAFADIDGVLRGKVIHTQKFLAGLDDGYGFCEVVFGWDSSDACYDAVDVTGWQTGYPDKPCRIDLNTFRTVPWQDDLPFFLADFSKADGNDLYTCPRSLLKRIAKEAENMGFKAEFAQEFEWFNFKETAETLEQKSYTRLDTLSRGMFGYSILRTSEHYNYYNDLFDLLYKFDVPLEGLHTETGPGVYEAAILHDEVLAAADKAVLFKTAVKEIAAKHGIMASFMAKWNADLPGCSGHIHQSLWQNGVNLFYDANNSKGMSQLCEQYIAGQLYCMPHILPMYAPTINSYKRLIEGAWAPTTLTWGVDNRTTALRVLHPSVDYTRVETRVPGADSNPYLAMAAALASGLYGIKNKMSLHIKPTQGNGYLDTQNGKLQPDLLSAATDMQQSALAKELFGDAFVQHFTTTRLWECSRYAKHVSDWELKRYMEII